MGKVDKVYRRMGKLKLAILGYLAGLEGGLGEGTKRSFQIAIAVGTTKPNAVRSLKNMEKEGLVAKACAIEWYITLEGRDALEDALDERRTRAETNKRRANQTLDQIDNLTTT